jgi:hypothetical protein
VSRHFDDLDAILESDSLDDFRQLIFALQSPPGFCGRYDELEHHQLGGRRRQGSLRPHRPMTDRSEHALDDVRRWSQCSAGKSKKASRAQPGRAPWRAGPRLAQPRSGWRAAAHGRAARRGRYRRARSAAQPAICDFDRISGNFLQKIGLGRNDRSLGRRPKHNGDRSDRWRHLSGRFQLTSRWIDSDWTMVSRLVGDVDRMTPNALIAFYVAPRFEDINLK